MGVYNDASITRVKLTPLIGTCHPNLDSCLQTRLTLLWPFELHPEGYGPTFVNECLAL
jgi:hypothetical protein